MRRRLPAAGAGLLVALALAAGSAAQSAPPAGGTPAAQAPPSERPPAERPPSEGVVPQQAIAAARDAVYPALVNLTVVARTFADGRTVRYPASGSGVVVTREGHVLTNYHVAGDATRITATLTSGEVLDAEVVVHDPLTDLSVLRLRLPEGRAVPVARLGDSDALEVGDPVLAMGNPLALSSSVSLGIVANPRRVFTGPGGVAIEEMELEVGERTGLLTRWIQHDALILPGNSGGPLVDLAGEVVGINELGGAGIGFAIPSNVASRVLTQAIEHGEVRRGWLGFTVLPVAKLGRETGALVSAVLPGSPAAAAGLEPGDVLVGLAGEPVDARFAEQVPLVYGRVAGLPIGAEVELVVERGALADGGGRETLTATVEEMQAAPGAEAEVAALGVTVQEVTRPLALDLGLPSDRGVRITGVRPGSPGEQARPALSAGDVLLSFAGRETELPADLAAAVEASGGGPSLAVVRRGREELVTVVERKDEPDPRFGGALPQAWLGVRTQVVGEELARALGLDEAGGFRVTEVFPETEASRAGLVVGDVIRSIDGEALDATRAQEREDLRRAVERRGPGEEVVLGVVRPGSAAGPREVRLPLEAQPVEPSVADRHRQDELEVAVRELTFGDRLDRGWPSSQEGVLVVEVAQGGWAHMAGLRLGDLILRVAGEEVDDVEDFAAAVGDALAGRPSVLLVFVRRDGLTHFVFIEPDWPRDGVEGAAPEPAGERRRR